VTSEVPATLLSKWQVALEFAEGHIQTPTKNPPKEKLVDDDSNSIFAILSIPWNFNITSPSTNKDSMGCLSRKFNR